MVKYLLDTNAISYAFRGEGRVAQRLLATSPADVGIPAPVLYEARAAILKLTAGARREAMSAALDRLIRTVEVVPLDERAAEEAARIRADLESRGTPIGPIDTEIAGIARACGATLVTRNLREFGRIEALSLDDWY